MSNLSWTAIKIWVRKNNKKLLRFCQNISQDISWYKENEIKIFIGFKCAFEIEIFLCDSLSKVYPIDLFFNILIHSISTDYIF